MYGVQAQVDVGEDRLGGTDDRPELLEALGLQPGPELAVEDGARLLGGGVWVTPWSTRLPPSEEFCCYCYRHAYNRHKSSPIWYNTREVRSNESYYLSRI